MFALLNMLIGQAYAADTAPAAPAAQGASSASSPSVLAVIEEGLFGPHAPAFVAILVLAYFMLIRPQQRREVEHAAMIKALKPGDRIVTSGGVVGTVAKIEDDSFIILEIADNVRVKVVRTAVAERAETASPDKKA